MWPALALLGCGGDANGPNAVPALGDYAYQATLYVRANPTPISYSGTLTLTYASAESIAGVWDVPGYQPAGKRRPGLLKPQGLVVDLIHL